MKTIIDVFNNRDVFNNHEVTNSTNISTYLSKKLHNYYSDLSQINDEDYELLELKNILPIIKEFSDGIIESLSSYFDGKPSRAFTLFSKMMDNIWPQIRIFYRTDMKMTKLFRCRRWEANKDLSKNEIYHIPFEDRYKVGNQRYSINGFPCLYLSTSVLCCINEIGCKVNERFIVSKYMLMNKMPKVLDLTIDYQKARESTIKDPKIAEWFLNMIREGVKSKLLLLPLILATSIKNNQNPSFKSEYVIPQILLEWVRESQEIDCIIYYSHENFGNNKSTDLLTNYVFPPKSVKSTGYCEDILNFFNISEPKEFVLKSCSGQIENYVDNYVSNEYGEIEKEL